MADRVLTLRELNRATLARQMLLERAALPIPEALERLAGLQAQVPNPPYIGLWTRLRDFSRQDLTHLMQQRRVVRAAMMRSTLHLVTAEDHALLRPSLHPALERAFNSFFGKKSRNLDIDRLVAAAREYLEESPRTTGELRNLLSEVEPDGDPDAMAYAVRTYLPLVQVPPGGTWGSGSRVSYANADSWLGGSLRDSPNSGGLRELMLRYLAAFGPATVKDVQAWSGLVRLKELVGDLKPELRTFQDEEGNELLDAPGAPIPDADILAPARFVPEYDNLLLAHADRRRIIADEHRKRVFLSAARVRATFLLDGIVSGTWKIERDKSASALVIEPFGSLNDEYRNSLLEEGESLLCFVGEAAESFEIRFSG